MGADLNPALEPKLMDFTKALFTSLSIELASASSSVWAPILSQVLRDYLNSLQLFELFPFWVSAYPVLILL